MIDYEKLKEAHDLAELYGKQIDEWIDIAVTFNGPTKNHPFPFAFGPTGKDFDDRFFTLDELIDKLKELTKPKPKFKLGDQVWIYNYYAHRIDCFVVDAIDLESFRYSGKIKGSAAEYEEIRECNIYSSREELIDAQIKHWQSLKHQEEKPPIYDMKSFVSSYNQACDTVINDVLSDTGIEVGKKEESRKHAKATVKSWIDYMQEHDIKFPQFESPQCWHLPDGLKYTNEKMSGIKKCIKCGEFY